MSFCTSRLPSARFSAFPIFGLLMVVLVLGASATLVRAASIRGVVTDASGARVKGANVALLSNGQVVANAVSGTDGSYEILTVKPGPVPGPGATRISEAPAERSPVLSSRAPPRRLR